MQWAEFSDFARKWWSCLDYIVLLKISDDGLHYMQIINTNMFRGVEYKKQVKKE